MKRLQRVVLSAAFAALMSAGASAQNANPQIPVIDGPTYLMIYVEVVPSASARAIAMMKEYRDTSRKEAGANFIDIYQEAGQTHRFILSEIWQNRAIAKAHTDGPALGALFSKLKPIEIGPSDIRIHQAHMVTPPKTPKANDVFIISHVDVAGQGNLAKLITMLNTLGEASQKDNGMVRYEILDEVPAHANHFRVYEEWTSMATWEAHNLATHAQAYHDALLPLLGTPYDQRLYRLVN
jgi:quinol monooxygenase YgiN